MMREKGQNRREGRKEGKNMREGRRMGKNAVGESGRKEKNRREWEEGKA